LAGQREKEERYRLRYKGDIDRLIYRLKNKLKGRGKKKKE
jgi:hypothetical protein